MQTILVGPPFPASRLWGLLLCCPDSAVAVSAGVCVMRGQESSFLGTVAIRSRWPWAFHPLVFSEHLLGAGLLSGLEAQQAARWGLPIPCSQHHSLNWPAQRPRAGSRPLGEASRPRICCLPCSHASPVSPGLRQRVCRIKPGEEAMSRANADRREVPGLRPGAWEGHPGSLGRALSRRPSWGYKEWGPGQPQEPADQSCGPRCLARPQGCTPSR